MPDIAGSYSSVATSTLTFGDWWIEDPSDPAGTYNHILSVANDNFVRGKKEEQSVYEPLNRPNVVVVRGQIRGERFKLRLEYLDYATWQKFEGIRNLQRTLLLKRGYTGEQWYGVFGEARDITEARHDANYKLIDVEFIETDAP